MTKAEQLLEMRDLQIKLNNATNGPDWAITGLTREGRKINWKRCIQMETAEAINSLNWKHWKDINGESDIENVKVEIVDNGHFIISLFITEGVSISILNDEPLNGELGLLDALQGMMDSLSHGEHVLLATYFNAAIAAIDDFTFDDVYRIYIGKNCLNEFRQNNGYKDGTYIKTWNGSEDNVTMMEIVSRMETVKYDDVYDALEKVYSAL